MTSGPHLITRALAVGVAELLVRPASWPRWARKAYIAASGAVISAVAATMLSPHPAAESPGRSETERAVQDPRPESVLGRAQTMPRPAKWAVCAGAGLATSTAQAGGLALDAGLERWLARRGLAHPRAVMAALAAAAQLAIDLPPPTHPRSGTQPDAGTAGGVSTPADQR